MWYAYLKIRVGKSVNIWNSKCMFETTMFWWYLIEKRANEPVMILCKYMGASVKVGLLPSSVIAKTVTRSDYEEKDIGFNICRYLNNNFIFKLTPLATLRHSLGYILFWVIGLDLDIVCFPRSDVVAPSTLLWRFGLIYFQIPTLMLWLETSIG